MLHSGENVTGPVKCFMNLSFKLESLGNISALREPLGVRPAPAAGRKSNGLGSSFVTCAPLRPRGLPWAPGGDKASASRRSVDSGAQGLRGHMFASGQKRVGGSWRILTQFRRVRSPRNGQRDQSAATRPAAVLTRACPCLVPGVGWSCTGHLQSLRTQLLTWALVGVKGQHPQI